MLKLYRASENLGCWGIKVGPGLGWLYADLYPRDWAGTRAWPGLFIRVFGVRFWITPKGVRRG